MNALASISSVARPFQRPAQPAAVQPADEPRSASPLAVTDRVTVAPAALAMPPVDRVAQTTARTVPTAFQAPLGAASAEWPVIAALQVARHTGSPSASVAVVPARPEPARAALVAAVYAAHR